MVRVVARRRLAFVFVSVVVAAAVLGPSGWSGGALAGAGPPTYEAPVSPPGAVLVGHFRPPPTPYAAGDRGLDYATAPDTPVVASAAGQVVFAGPVAGTLAVTVLHPDGLRTSYSFLATVAVRVGDQVEQGRLIATTGTFFHFGVRDPTGRYLDPEALFAGRGRVRLVPGADEGVARLRPGGDAGWADEAAALAGVVADASASLVASRLALAHQVLALDPARSLPGLVSELDQWRRSQVGCTPASEVPPRPPGRRVVVLVAGLGSNDRHASIDDVDTRSLGYAPGDVVRFSYQGGRAAGRPAPNADLATGLPVTSYDSADTQTDLRATAARLVTLVQALSRRAPGVPIDVIAHSQGGVVVHLALIQGAAQGRLPPALGQVVTIASPHQGTDLATGLSSLRGDLGLETGLATVHDAGEDLNPDSTSLAQLSETSAVSQEMRRPLPPGVHLRSIGAVGDPVVPWVRTLTPGATSAMVPAGGINTHRDLPGSPAVTREIALALAGRGPTCQSWTVGVAGVTTSHLVAQGEDALAVDLTLGGGP
jgi:hypothetical protein